jgi:SAM-dependent methyltransferase
MQCPACRVAVESQPLHRYSSDQAAAHFCPPSRDADRFARLQATVRRLWGGDTADVHVCTACGFGFGWPHVGGDEEYYSILHEQAGYPSDRWEYGLTMSRVLARFPDGGAILDVGTGDGSFLKKLPPAWKRYATEGSDTTRERLRRDGIECFESTGAAVRQAAGTFQAVTMFQVLEHVAAFDALLGDCFRLLRPGGVIAISVPLATAMCAQERLTGCQDMIPNHINKWSPEALAVVLRRAGFEPEPAAIEPGGLGAAVYRAGLMTRAQAASCPSSLAARTYGIRFRPARITLLAAISGLNLFSSLASLPSLMTGSSFLMTGRTPSSPRASDVPLP